MERFAGLTKDSIIRTGAKPGEDFDFGFETTRSKGKKDPVKKATKKKVPKIPSKSTVRKYMRMHPPTSGLKSVTLKTKNFLQPHGNRTPLFSGKNQVVFSVPFLTDRYAKDEYGEPRLWRVDGQIVAFGYEQQGKIVFRFFVSRPSLKHRPYGSTNNDKNIWPSTGVYDNLSELVKGVQEALREEEKWAKTFLKQKKEDLKRFWEARKKGEKPVIKGDGELDPKDSRVPYTNGPVAVVKVKGRFHVRLHSSNFVQAVDVVEGLNTLGEAIKAADRIAKYPGRYRKAFKLL